MLENQNIKKMNLLTKAFVALLSFYIFIMVVSILWLLGFPGAKFWGLLYGIAFS